MTDIGLVEFFSHWHILYYFARIANASGNDVTIFTTPDMHDRIADEFEEEEYEEITWTLQGKDEGHGSFLDRVERASANLDFLMVNTLNGTISEMWNFARFDPRCASMTWAYNVNAWLRPRPVVGWPPDTYVSKNLKMLLRPRILRNFDAINVEYSVWKEYIETETAYDGPVFSLSPTLYEPRDGDTTNEDETPFTLTIPGSISSVRNYEFALDVFETFAEHYEGDARLALLGRPRGDAFGERVIARCEDTIDRGFDVTFYEEWIPQRVFNEMLQETDVIFAPIRTERVKRQSYEYMGTTTGTGLIFDALRNARPIVLPSFYPIGEELDDTALHFDGKDDLVALFSRLAGGRDELERLKERALENSRRFDLAHQREEFERVVDRVIDSWSS